MTGTALRADPRTDDVLVGRRVVVTGAGGGIGEACARRLAAAGGHVVVVDRDAEQAKRVAAAVDGEAVVLDLTDLDSLAEVAQGAEVLVNNAGVQHVAPVHEFPVERFALMLDLMLEAPFRLARAALPGMYAAGWGRIVSISSVHGLRASAYKSAYVAAKHGLEGLTKVLALEGGPHGVTANTVCPGYVRTPLVEGQVADQARLHGIPEDDVVEQVLLSESAVKRLVEPDEVAEVVAYLCSPAARSVNGAAWTLDGGWTAR